MKKIKVYIIIPNKPKKYFYISYNLDDTEFTSKSMNILTTKILNIIHVENLCLTSISMCIKNPLKFTLKGLFIDIVDNIYFEVKTVYSND